MRNTDIADHISFDATQMDALKATMGGGTQATMAQTREEIWQVLETDCLTMVTNLLDSLENHGVRNRQVIALSNGCFAVRWRTK